MAQNNISYEVNPFWIKFFKVFGAYMILLMVVVIATNMYILTTPSDVDPYILDVIKGLIVSSITVAIISFIVSYTLARVPKRNIDRLINKFMSTTRKSMDVRYNGVLGSLLVLVTIILYLGMPHYSLIIQLLILISLIMVLTGIVYYSRNVNDKEKMTIGVKVIEQGISIAVVSILGYFAIEYNVFNDYMLLPAILAGFTLIGLAVISYLASYGEYGNVAPVAMSIILCLLLIVMPFTIPYAVNSVDTSFKIPLILFSCYTYISLITMTLILLAIGVEVIIDKTESYAMGTAYTLIMLMLAIYVIQSITVYSTVSILADTLKSNHNLITQFTLSMNYADKLGLLLVSPKILFALLLFISIAFIVGFILVRPEKRYQPKYEETVGIE
ncbi:hypothetical protein J4526_08655 [Desulfurococcaceae archaeon MEX13E-LK6-19]|nr:hypothetical protein J4526_08655 [Desulfurococcaceae archaeon MEX13E-LK6-19]